jgi:hypothetical protein
MNKINDSLDILSVIRKLERVGDQTKNIAEEIIFYIDAKVIKHGKKIIRVKEYFYQMYHWNKHLLWLFYKMLQSFIMFNFHDGVDSYYWIRFHLKYKSTKIK